MNLECTGLAGEGFLEQALGWGNGGLGKERRPEAQASLADTCTNAAEEWRGPKKDVSYCLQRNGFSECVIAKCELTLLCSQLSSSLSS